MSYPLGRVTLKLKAATFEIMQTKSRTGPFPASSFTVDKFGKYCIDVTDKTYQRLLENVDEITPTIDDVLVSMCQNLHHGNKH